MLSFNFVCGTLFFLCGYICLEIWYAKEKTQKTKIIHSSIIFLLFLCLCTYLYKYHHDFFQNTEKVECKNQILHGTYVGMIKYSEFQKYCVILPYSTTKETIINGIKFKHINDNVFGALNKIKIVEGIPYDDFDSKITFEEVAKAQKILL